MERILLALIRAYQLTLSPIVGYHCRFTPSCSRYAAEAIQLHGAARGSWLAIRRIGRCHPFCEGGLDPVPQPESPESRDLPEHGGGGDGEPDR
jgi:hypothetical protein